MTIGLKPSSSYSRVTSMMTVRRIFIITRMCSVRLVSLSEQFRFFRITRLVNLKVFVGLILSKVSGMKEILFPSICLHGLSYLYLVSFTLVEHHLFLIHLWSYFHNNLSEWHMLSVHFERFMVSPILWTHNTVRFGGGHGV